ncbi:hypothetical protein EVAR_80818_1 [Eumeta japonica]|uniref:Uncharacterized protein n=1 Tax=Eumeta variegata TaxID=151549 RepID=A0A4C1WE30_EUMVA|nr:hypothetical protein EVAR_80818_1 [Eumeta japonica]
MQAFPFKEILYENVLNADFQKSFLSLHAFQSILGMPKFHLEYKFVTTTTHRRLFYTFIVTCALAGASFWDYYDSPKRNYHFDFPMYFLKRVLPVVTYAIFATKNHCDSKNYVTLVTALQKIEKKMNISRDKMYRRYFIAFFSICVFQVTFYLIYGLFKAATSVTWHYTSLSLMVINSADDAEILFCAFIVHFLTIRLNRWTELVSAFPFTSPDMDKALIGSKCEYMNCGNNLQTTFAIISRTFYKGMEMFKLQVKAADEDIPKLNQATTPNSTRESRISDY